MEGLQLHYNVSFSVWIPSPFLYLLSSAVAWFELFCFWKLVQGALFSHNITRVFSKINKLEPFISDTGLMALELH